MTSGVLLQQAARALNADWIALCPREPTGQRLKLPAPMPSKRRIRASRDEASPASSRVTPSFAKNPWRPSRAHHALHAAQGQIACLDRLANAVAAVETLPHGQFAMGIGLGRLHFVRGIVRVHGNRKRMAQLGPVQRQQIGHGGHRPQRGDARVVPPLALRIQAIAHRHDQFVADAQRPDHGRAAGPLRLRDSHDAGDDIAGMGAALRPEVKSLKS